MWACIYLLAVLVGGCQCVLDVDLGHELNKDSMVWVNDQPLKMKTRYNGFVDKGEGFWYKANEFCTPEHSSTHLDAPSHFTKDKWTVVDIPLQRLFGQGVVIDIRDKVKQDHNAEMTAGDLTAWMNKHGPLPDGAIVFVLTGWGSRYGNNTAYFGSADPSNLTFPGIHISAARFLTAYEGTTGSRIFGVGLDTPSLDHGPSVDFKTHVELFTGNIYGLENVANLEKLPVRGFEVIVMPIKLTEGSGAPSRIIARIPDTEDEMTSTLPTCEIKDIGKGSRTEKECRMPEKAEKQKSPLTNSSPGQSISHFVLLVLITLSCLLNSRCVV